ncbi:MAG: SpoIIE family protein phosphatase [Deltaproteobacteria bacterium]|jgi:serine phosphatase RsbU (regulator of sigma subunit)|nr:SpoIIE family protein phosphatase [Deltaproteobacteria bacterium]
MPGKSKPPKTEKAAKRSRHDRRTTAIGPPGIERRSGHDRRTVLKVPIFIKFITLSTLLTITVSTIISVAILQKQVEGFREQLISLGESLVRITAENAPDKLLTEEDLALFQLVRDVAALDQVYFALIADADGVIKAHSISEKNNTRMAPPKGYVLLNDAGPIRIGRFSEEDKEYLYFEKNLTYQTLQVGMVALAISQQKILEAVASAKQYIYLLTGIIILFGVLMSLLVSLYFSRPIKRLQEGTRAIRSGDFDHRVWIRRNDELGDLGHAFNQMSEGLKERNVMRRSLELAMEVQRSLLPMRDPNLAGLDIAGRSLYCDETGGDYYDYIQSARQSPGTIGLVLGDVSGHGIPSALLMATARAFIRQRSNWRGSLADIVQDVNRLLAHDVEDSSSFMTLFYLMIDRPNQTLNWVRAGHDPAILYDPVEDRFEELMGDGIPLGIDADWPYAVNERRELREGQIIVLGTDGTWEAHNAEGEMFGKQPLLDVIRERRDRSARNILDAAVEALNRFRGNHELEDDVTLLVAKVVSMDSASPSADKGQSP